MIGTRERRWGPVASALEAYLREIGQTPLLSAVEERGLALRIQRGDREARDLLVRSNLRLVVRLAGAYVGRGLDLPDLVAEGNLGLLRAAERFDPSRGTRFSTYAGYWIKQAIRRALCESSRTVRLPCYVVQMLAEWRRVAAALAEELGRQPTDAEVADQLGLPEKKLRLIKKAACVLSGGQPTENTDEAMSLEELVADGRDWDPEVALAQAEELEEVLRLVGELGVREREVLRLRFGLGDEGPMTLRDVGLLVGLTRERVRQIETAALDWLRDRLVGPA